MISYHISVLLFFLLFFFILILSSLLLFRNVSQKRNQEEELHDRMLNTIDGLSSVKYGQVFFKLIQIMCHLRHPSRMINTPDFTMFILKSLE